ncbi:MAG: MMPL family transporter [Bacteriovoracales bacterium]|nr:MMPL family transporter [Bacteriovoracales bacterium]
MTLGFFATKVSFDNSKWLSDSDPQEVLNRYIQENFNQEDELVVAVLLRQKFFSKPNIEALIRLDQKIKDTLQPKSYSHPLNLSFLFKDNPNDMDDEGVGHIEVNTFQKQITENKRSLSELEQEFQKSYYRGRYISFDQKSFLILLRPVGQKTIEGEIQERARLVHGMKTLLKEEPLFQDYKMAGSVKLHDQMDAQNQKELFFLIPIIFLMIVTLLSLYYMNLKVVGIIIFSSLLTLAGAFSLFYFLDLTVNVLTSIAPLLIMAIAISDSIHIINYYISQKEQNSFQWPSFMKFTWRPCLITSLTTAMGFLSFHGSKIILIKQLSIVASLAVILAYVLIIFSNWSLLYLLAPQISPRKISFDFLSPFLVFKKSLLKTSSAMALAVFGAISIYQFSFTETNFLDSFFKKDSQIQKDFAYIDENHGGTGALDLILNRPTSARERSIATTGKNNLVDFKDIKNYQKFVGLGSVLKDLPYVKRLETYVMPVRMVHEKLTTNQGIDPTNSEKLAQEILFLEFSQSSESEDLLRPFLSFDEKQKSGRLVLRTRNLSNVEAAELKKEVDKKMDILGWNVDYGGNSQYFLRLSELILNTQTYSLMITFLMVFILMFFFYNIKAAFLIIIANILPVVGVLFCIVASKNPFDFSTILISSIGLGICVDDNIHLIHHIFKSSKPFTNAERLKAVFISALRPIIIVSILFVGVFLIFSTSKVVLLQRFGLFSALMIAISLLINIFLLPPILSRQTSHSPRR